MIVLFYFHAQNEGKIWLKMNNHFNSVLQPRVIASWCQTKWAGSASGKQEGKNNISFAHRTNTHTHTLLQKHVHIYRLRGRRRHEHTTKRILRLQGLPTDVWIHVCSRIKESCHKRRNWKKERTVWLWMCMYDCMSDCEWVAECACSTNSDQFMHFSISV